MDPVTHTLTGAVLSRAGLNRVTPHSMVLAMVASNIPDIDVVSAWWGTTAYLDYHRGWTHTVWAAPVMALLPVALVKWGLRRPLAFLPAWGACTFTVLVHLAMDYLTAYGMRPWAPFEMTWTGWPVFFIFEAAAVLALLLGVAAPALSSLVSGEIGGRKSTGRGWAIFALAFVLCWVGFKGLMRERALQMMHGRMYEGKVPRRVEALPTAANPFRWRGLVETENTLSVHVVNVLGEFDPEAGDIHVKPRRTDAVEAARRGERTGRFLDFAQWPAFRVVPKDEPAGAVRVDIRDLRFNGGFDASVVLDRNLRVIDEAVNGGGMRDNPSK